ncbi:right-handed parallel beta-helix repeat-containing protein, partial [Pelagicoccus mobilis]
NIDGTGEMFNNRDVHITNCYFENMNEMWGENGDILGLPIDELSWGAGIWLGGTIPSVLPPAGYSPSEQSLLLDDFSVTHCGFQDVDTGLGTGFYYPRPYRSRFTNFRFEDSWVTGCVNGAFALFSVDGGHAKRIDTWVGGTVEYNSGTTGGFVQDCKNFLIEDCQFGGNIRPGKSADGVGFDIEGHCENVSIRDCVIHDNDGAGLLVLNTGGWNEGLLVERMTLWNNARNPKADPEMAVTDNAELRYAGGAPNPSLYGRLSNVGIYRGSDIGVGTPNIYDVSGNWARDFSPSGVRSGTPWSAVSGRPRSWTFEVSTEGWGGQNHWDGLGASGGALVGTSSDVDPFVVSPDTWVNTRESQWLKIRMSSTKGQVAQIFFQTEVEPWFSADKSVSFGVTDDGQYHDYVVDMASVETYSGVVTKWRIDPTIEAGSVMQIDEFSLEKTPYVTSVEVVTPTRLDVRFNQAVHIDGGVLDPSNYLIGGTGKGSLSSYPDFVSQISTETGPVYRLDWDSGEIGALEDLVLIATSIMDPRGNFVSAYELDMDRDRIPDVWELINGLDPRDPLDALDDADEDGRSNFDEYDFGTDPNNGYIEEVNYYVSWSSGDDGNKGTSQSQAWKSFDNLVDLSLLPGTTVYLNRGDVWTNTMLALKGGGTEDMPVRLSAYGAGALPIITGTDSDSGICVLWQDPTYVSIDSLHLSDARVGVYFSTVSQVLNGEGNLFSNQGVHVLDCVFESIKDTPVSYVAD